MKNISEKHNSYKNRSILILNKSFVVLIRHKPFIIFYMIKKLNRFESEFTNV
jgi:hypothetical protein